MAGKKPKPNSKEEPLSENPWIAYPQIFIRAYGYKVAGVGLIAFLIFLAFYFGGFFNSADVPGPVPVAESKNQTIENNKGIAIQGNVGGNVNQNVLPPELPPTIFVHLAPKDGAPVAGEFFIRYSRPDMKAGSATGYDGEAEIKDISIRPEQLDVIEFKHPQLKFAFPKNDKGIWPCDIDDGGNVYVPVTSKYVPFHVPSREEMRTLIEAAGLTKDDILHVELTEDEKKEIAVNVVNEAGRKFRLWMYDCWWCYHDDEPGKLRRAKCPDKRVEASDNQVQLKSFGRTESTSGFFVLFIEYGEAGESQFEPMGIYNLYRPKNRELVVSVNEVKEPSDKLYHVTPPPDAPGTAP